MRAPYGKFAVTLDSFVGVNQVRHLDERQRNRLLTRCEGRVYERKRIIFHHLDKSHDVFFIMSGRVQVTVFSPDGKVVTFDELRAGDMFGEVAALDDAFRIASVVAVQETRVLCLQGKVFRTLVFENEDFGLEVVRRLTHLVRHLCSRVFELHLLPVSDRVRVEFLRLAEAEMEAETDQTAVLSPRPTDQDIANRVGTNREQVNRERKKLERARVFQETDSGLLVDIAALRRLVSEKITQSPVP